MEKTKMTEKQTKLPEMKGEDVQSLDLQQYIGKTTEIESLKIEQGTHGSYLRVETKQIDTLEDGKPLKVSRLFNLITTDSGISYSNNGKLKEYLDNKKLIDYRDLVGVVVIVLSETKNGKDWLTFN